MGGERKVGPGATEHRLLNPRELANHHSQLAHFGGDNGWRSCHGYARLMLSQRSKINIFRFISYALCGATTRLRRTIVPGVPASYAPRLKPGGSTPPPTVIFFPPLRCPPDVPPPREATSESQPQIPQPLAYTGRTIPSTFSQTTSPQTRHTMQTLRLNRRSSTRLLIA